MMKLSRRELEAESTQSTQSTLKVNIYLTPLKTVTKRFDYIPRTSLIGKIWERFLFILYDSFFHRHDFLET